MNIETEITERLVTKILKAGYSIRVSDGDNTPTTDRAKILHQVGATDETYLTVYKRHGFILLIHGNGEDLISDCSDNPTILELTNI